MIKLLENLRSNKELLEKGKRFNFYYFLIESPAKINENFKINDFSYFYKIDQINDSENDFKNENIKKAVINLNQIKKTIKNTNFYILRIKIIDLTQKDVEHPVTKLSQIVDPEIGIGIAPSNICKDLINLFSLYFGAWFKIVPNFLFWEEADSFSLIKQKFKEISENKVGNDLLLNYNSITGLREDQFYLIQKSLSRFNQSLKSVDDDLELGLVLLVSTIENISRKYGGIEERFDETNEFYKKLKKIFEKLPQDIESFNRDDLFNEIGQAYLSLSYLRIKAKYKNFCLNSISPFIYNEKFEEMIDNLYDLRSKVLHAGESLEYYSRDQIIMYNPRNKAGKIKKFKDTKGKYLIIIRIPSYNDLLKIFADIIVNFIRYLYSVKDEEEDKARYKESDVKKRNMVMGAIKKEGFKPGYIVNLNTDFYRRIDFIDLTQIQNTLKAIERNINQTNTEEKLKKVEEIIQHPNFTTENIAFRRACYFKIIFLNDLEKYDECLGIFEKYQISKINEETFPVFNTKAYCLAKKGKFKEAHDIIDKVLEIVDKDNKNKSNFLDSKGDFYKMEGKITKAIEFYKKSLNITNKLPFHEETKKKLKECMDKKEDE